MSEATSAKADAGGGVPPVPAARWTRKLSYCAGGDQPRAAQETWPAQAATTSPVGGCGTVGGGGQTSTPVTGAPSTQATLPSARSLAVALPDEVSTTSGSPAMPNSETPARRLALARSVSTAARL